MTDGPALPWAAGENAEAVAQQEATDDVAPAPRSILRMEEAGLTAGARLEVKWNVEPDEGEAYTRWWGATLVGPSTEKHPDHPDASVYELAYDAHDDFDQEKSHVVLMGEHSLLQLDQTEELTWRREGDEWDEVPEDGDDEEEVVDGEAVVTMEDLAEEEKELLGGKTLEEAESEAMSTLEPAKRIAVAAGFRDFADNLVSFLHDVVGSAPESDGGPPTVTAEHVQAFVEHMAKKQRTR
ncbi:hypothetical protein CHLRE_06g298700v5 [Chlamydomonas reinhardtii]|uniref:Uncharacterized protein n=1 Tax=Chlamydomonas reinhardtii TaxID=3055 RepID=A8IP15_CHLRE|nr:uncharacterized protein CHLRE_06g298700v5 [Chlamydomonas reinhardtii]PNW82896.1 hypothetical protein CHLRE_06g298700v5 [Chlamydomonas reinhardtii]|eukprot:XP_001691451.1 predicted protein [Chlamydomonas reinhardtii]